MGVPAFHRWAAAVLQAPCWKGGRGGITTGTTLYQHAEQRTGSLFHTDIVPLCPIFIILSTAVRYLFIICNIVKRIFKLHQVILMCG